MYDDVGTVHGSRQRLEIKDITLDEVEVGVSSKRLCLERISSQVVEYRDFVFLHQPAGQRRANESRAACYEHIFVFYHDLPLSAVNI